MNFSSGVGKRGPAAIAVAFAIITLTSCSSGDPASPDKAKSSATPTPDRAAKDRQAAIAVYQRYWAAVTKAENEVNADPQLFSGFADGSFVEVELKQVRDAKKFGVTRRGAPTIDKYAATINGDVATVVACLDEDDWKYYDHGKLVKDKRRGGTPVGGRLERRSSAWVMVATLISKDIQKTC